MEEDKISHMMVENFFAAIINGGAICATLRSNMHWAWKALIGTQFGLFMAKDIIVAYLAHMASKMEDTTETEETEES